MKLSVFANMFLSCPENVPSVKLYIFNSEGSADDWIKDTYFGKNTRDWDLLAVYQSDYKMERCFNERLCNAEVEYFYAVAQDTMVVRIKPEEK